MAILELIHAKRVPTAGSNDLAERMLLLEQNQSDLEREIRKSMTNLNNFELIARSLEPATHLSNV